MTRQLRNRNPEKLHMITCRIRCAEMWFIPNKELNELVGGIVARYQEMYEIELFAYTFLSDHYHQLVRARKENLARYAEDLNKQLALRINRYWRRQGTLWGRRYSDQITITEVDGLYGWLYATTNATKHGLVHHPRQWPGLSSWNHCQTGKDPIYPFTHWDSYHRAKRKAPPGKVVRLSDYQTKHTLKITPLPQYAHLSWEERNGILVPKVEERIEELHKEREKEGKGFLGRKQVLVQLPGTLPKEISNSPQPSCYSKSPEAIKQYHSEQRQTREAYTEASYRFRSGEYDVEFPKYTYRPPLHHVPKPKPPLQQAPP